MIPSRCRVHADENDSMSSSVLRRRCRIGTPEQWARMFGNGSSSVSSSAVRSSSEEQTYKDGYLTVPHTIQTVCDRSSNNRTTNKKVDTKEDQRRSIYYRIYNPKYLNSMNHPPLLVLHGGPGLPSEYLYPIVDHMRSPRSIIFYDQLGCGRSDQPPDVDAYSISKSVHDLEDVITSLNLPRFHLLGHSYGGVLAYEYVKQKCERAAEANSSNSQSAINCISIILSNTTTSMKLSQTERLRLITQVKEEKSDAQAACETFRKRNQCRTAELPKPLADAVGHAGKIWHGTNVVSDYVASAVSSTEAARLLPPALLIRGEHDFVTKVCTDGWRALFRQGNGFREELMYGCSHYCHLENGEKYSELLERFCAESDERGS